MLVNIKLLISNDIIVDSYSTRKSQVSFSYYLT